MGNPFFYNFIANYRNVTSLVSMFIFASLLVRVDLVVSITVVYAQRPVRLSLSTGL